MQYIMGFKVLFNKASCRVIILSEIACKLIRLTVLFTFGQSTCNAVLLLLTFQCDKWHDISCYGVFGHQALDRHVLRTVFFFRVVDGFCGKPRKAHNVPRRIYAAIGIKSHIHMRCKN